VDPLADLLAGPRARGAFTLRAQFETPWSIDVQDDAPLTVIAVLTGTARLRLDGVDEPLRPGDVAVVQGPQAYVVSDGQGTAPTVQILPGNHCVDLDGRPVAESMSHGLRTWGNAAGGDDVLLIGVYSSVGEVGRLLTQALPPWLLVRGDSHVGEVIRLMGREIALDAPGQGSLLDRLLDVVLVSAIRSYATEAPGPSGSWLTTRDPLVTAALDLMHEDPTRRWTLESLARAIRGSRATLSRRFAAEVGEPPMGHLTRLRLAMAADLLSDPETTVASAARSVGYATPFALSAAFKRQFGASPSEYRRAAPELPTGASPAR
jgi:AraC-like DNA-binding protein